MSDDSSTQEKKPENNGGCPPKPGVSPGGRTPGQNATVAMKVCPEELGDPYIGIQMDNYRITGLLGAGGFGKVYQARDTALGRDVAIKFMRSFGEEGKQALFEREAQAIAALSKHPNIVDIHHWGVYGGQNYFVLEYVESNAVKLIEEHPQGLPLALALRITADCAAALYEAHTNGILHRDVKPANILIESGTQQAKLTDFGLARMGYASEYTLAGTISGSPSFMSPEQANAEPLDGRTDIFSLGVTLYELLSGGRPFDGNSAEETIDRIRKNKRVPLVKRRPDLPAAIYAIVDKATAHAREDRYSSAAEFGRQIRLALQSLERCGRVEPLSSDANPTLPQSRLYGARQRRSGRVIAVTAGLVLFAAGIGFGLWRMIPDRSHLALDPAFTIAKECMNRGAFKDAVPAYRQCLIKNPEHPRVLYGLGLALVGVGQLDESESVIGRIADPALKAEAQAAAVFARRPDNIRPKIESAVDASEGKYPVVLLAKLDLLENAYEQAVRRVDGTRAEQFNFAYQYAEALQAAGQANYHLNKLSEAKAAFSQLSELRGPEGGALAKGYLAEIEQRLDASRREELHTQVLEIRKLIESGNTAALPGDEWTSRPLTFFLMPPETRRSRYAIESGLADLLPGWLGDKLDAETSMNLLDRALINEILAEQSLSALAGSKEGQIRLGRVLGARLLLKCEFDALNGQDKLLLRMDDVETTERIPTPALNIAADDLPESVVSAAAEVVWNAARRQYPLRARVYRAGEQLVLNIGGSVGLAEGMAFDVLSDAEAPPIPGAQVVVQGTPGAASAVVTATGLEAAAIGETPGQGWFVIQREEEAQ